MKPKFHPESHAYYSYMTNNVFLFLGCVPDLDLNTFNEIVETARLDILHDDDTPIEHRRYALDYLTFIDETIPMQLNLK